MAHVALKLKSTHNCAVIACKNQLKLCKYCLNSNVQSFVELQQSKHFNTYIMSSQLLYIDNTYRCFLVYKIHVNWRAILACIFVLF